MSSDMLSKTKSKTNLLVHIFIMSLILFTQIFYQVVYAQETPELLSQSDPALKLQLLKPTEQDYPSKNFKVTLIVDSLIDSNRVGVTWTYPTNLMTPVGGATDVITVVSGEKTTLVKEFIPSSNPPKSVVNRNAEIGVRVNGFVAGENYISTEKVVITFNPEMEILPLLDNYSQAKNLDKFKNISAIVLVVVLVIVGGFIGIKKFLKYLNTSDVE